MKTLAINTASSQTGIALLDGQMLIAEDSWQARNDEAEKLLPAIKELVSDFEEIKRVIVVRGPGSFTGLRVGIAVANTIAYLTGAELYALSTLEYWHLQSDLPCLVFAGSRGVYLEDELIPLDELYQTLIDRQITQVTGDISADQIKELKDIEFVVPTDTFGQSISRFTPGQPTKIVEPLYIKEPNISQSKKTTCYT